MSDYTIQMLESPDDLSAVEDLQRMIWPGDDTEVVPVHMLVAAVRGGGLVMGAYTSLDGVGPESQLVGFVFGFPGFYLTPDGPRIKHCSHMLGWTTDKTLFTYVGSASRSPRSRSGDCP